MRSRSTPLICERGDGRRLTLRRNSCERRVCLHATVKYRLPGHRLQLREYLRHVLLSRIPSEFVRHIRPGGSPSTRTPGPAYVALT